ncbi:MAG TPA: TrkH family potassium uptake protein, partial [Deltaproteobacteria bacterium]|nr:TrkH family potassium uptake protein [Deltaproteobacteria bacterium]
MHLPTLLHLTGGVLLAIAGLLLIPFGCTFLYNEPDWYALLLTIALSASMGIVLWLGFRKSQRLDELKAKEGFVLVAFCWIVITAVSALPFVWHGAIPSFTEAFFEVMSGYTTTGATVLTNIEALPHGLLLWRTLTHFVGGMGVVVLYLTLFAGIGSSGLRLFQAEAAPGQSVGGRRLVPRIRETIRWLWGIYVGLHVIQIILLYSGGMPLFDAFIHATSSIATAGFSNRNGSLGAYGSAYFEWVCIVFMLLGGLDFTLQHKCLVGRWKTVWQSTELKAYFGIVLVLGLGTSLVLWTQNTHGSLLDAL